MIRLCRTFLAIAVTLLSSIQVNAQVITTLTETKELPGNAENNIIKNIEDENGTLQSQFMDWNSTLGNFNEMVTISQKEIKAKIDSLEATEKPHKIPVKLNGKTLDLPSNIDENGIDLYMLTDEGITIYMALLAPKFYQETTPDIIKWIRYYAYSNRDKTLRTFIRYSQWENHIKNVFFRHNVPTEIAELCMIESACTYSATSTVGAKGMWQLMPDTARGWGLTVNEQIDERTDPVISTETAAKILKKDYDELRSWTMTIAAYNCGLGRVKQITKKDKSNEWLQIKKDFPKETQQYIPSLLAIHYVWNYRKQLGLSIDQ